MSTGTLSPITIQRCGPYNAPIPPQASEIILSMRPATISSFLFNRMKGMRFHEAWVQPWCEGDDPDETWECHPCRAYYSTHVDGRQTPEKFSMDHSAFDQWNAHCESHAHITAVEAFRHQKMFTIPRFGLDKHKHCPECQLTMSATTPNFLKAHWETECPRNPNSARKFRSPLHKPRTVYPHQVATTPPGPLVIRHDSPPVYYDVIHSYSHAFAEPCLQPGLILAY